MASMFTAMSLVLVGWAAWGGALVGIGLLALRLLGRRSRDPDRPAPWLAFWVGFSVVCAALQLWHFAFRVNDVARAAALLAGAIGVATHRGDLVEWWRARRAGPTCATVAMLVWLANRALAAGETADSGMYHYAAIDWITSFPLVVGLGNLSGWQALNNASFLYDALLDAGPFRDRIEHLANGLLVAAWAGQWCSAAGAVLRHVARPSEAFASVVLPLLVLFALGTEMSSPDNDLPGGMIALATGAAAIALVERGRDAAGWRGRAVILLAAATVCCKLSMIALAGGWVVAVLAWRWRAEHRDRLLAAAFAIGALTIGPWLLRNVLLTGYPLYPSPAAAMSVAWRVPVDRVEMHRDDVGESAHYSIPAWLSRVATRQGLGVYARFMQPAASSASEVTATNWIRPWLFTIPLWGPVEIVVPLAIATLVGVGSIRRRGAAAIATAMPPAVVIVPLAAIAFWFLVAPDPRFGWAACWSTLGVAAALATSTLVATFPRGCVAAVVALCAASLGFKIVAEKVMWRHNVLEHIPFVLPGADGGFHPRPRVDYVDWTSRYGVLIHEPANGGSLVWSGPLPRLGWPKPDPDLAYRVPGSLAGGFVIRRQPTTPR